MTTPRCVGWCRTANRRCRNRATRAGRWCKSHEPRALECWGGPFDGGTLRSAVGGALVFVAERWDGPEVSFEAWDDADDARAAGTLVGEYVREGRRWRWRRPQGEVLYA